MIFGEINFIILMFFWLLLTLAVNVNTALHLLLTAEFLWITLYILAAMIGLIADNPNLLTLTFFFLILSAVEFGVGLVLMLLQTIFQRSIYLTDMEANPIKFTMRILNKLNLNTTKI